MSAQPQPEPAVAAKPPGWLRAIDTRAKLVLLLALSIAAVMLDTAATLAALCGVGGVLLFAARPTLRQSLGVVALLAALAWSAVLSQGIFYARYPRTPLLTLVPPGDAFEGIAIYREGLVYGAIQSLRMLALALAGIAVCLSTSPQQFLTALVALRAPYGLAFLATTAIRFLPEAARELSEVRLAMWLRGYRPFRQGLLTTLRCELGVFRPLLARAVRRAQAIALSLAARGFSPEDPPRIAPARMGAASRAIIATAVLFSLALVAVKTLFWLYVLGVFYAAELRPLYGFVREWL